MNLLEITYKNSAKSRKVHTRIALAVVQHDDEVILSVRSLGEYAGDWCQLPA